VTKFGPSKAALRVREVSTPAVDRALKAITSKAGPGADDQLGHAQPSLTQEVYMGRKVVTAEAARLLDRLKLRCARVRSTCVANKIISARSQLSRRRWTIN
jgi:hypothetical protein